MIKRITHASLYVRDIDEAQQWYTEMLGFVVRSDSPMEGGDRWVTVSPEDQPEFEVVLQPTHWGTDEQSAAEREALIGKSPGFVLQVSDVRGLMTTLKGKGVEFTMELTEFPWGTQTALKDLYGNVHVVSQPPQA